MVVNYFGKIGRIYCSFVYGVREVVIFFLDSRFGVVFRRRVLIEKAVEGRFFILFRWCLYRCTYA